ncbi:hypothetical protein KM043_013331 [Ampulex compressa]|nr:hypothetical protein KM043_013331 [Ampulex compressa]
MRSYGSQQTDEIEKRTEIHTRLAQHEPKKPQRLPFIKNLFLGHLDTEFLNFPDPFSNDRYQEFIEWLKPVENYMSYVVSEDTNLSKDEILNALRDLKVLQASMGELYDGLNLSASETSKLIEIISALPWLERDFGGITCTSVQDTIGQKNVAMCTIKFEDTLIPMENELGDVHTTNNILLDLWAPGKQNMSGQAVSILRNFLNMLIKHILPRQHLDKNMYEFESIQNTISKIAASLYSMESVLYLTNGMIDTYNKQDVDAEKAVTELYCATECVKSIYEGLQIIGAQSYLKESPFIKQFLDALALVTFEGYNIDTQVYIALLGTQYAGKNFVRTYVLIATLARASRSYCYGVRNANYERQLALALSYNTHQRIKVLASEIEVGEIYNSNLAYEQIAQVMFEKKEYFAEHILRRIV